jgi:hypothetical protein
LLKKSARLLLGRKNDFPEFFEISLFMCANNSNNEALAGRTDPIQKRVTAITAGQRKVEKWRQRSTYWMWPIGLVTHEFPSPPLGEGVKDFAFASFLLNVQVMDPSFVRWSGRSISA